MENAYNQTLTNEISPHVHWGHFSTVVSVAVFLIATTWLTKPELFNFKKNIVAENSDAPKYYAYQTPDEDLPKPEVLGASTNQGPSIINEDGTVVPVDTSGQVLGASTQNQLPTLNQISVNAINDSSQAIQKYFTDSSALENGAVDNNDFETALVSNDKNLISQQVKKLTHTRDNLIALQVPQSLIKLNKLKIIQYDASINVLNNFTEANDNPELVGGFLQQFLQSEQDLESESNRINQLYNNSAQTIVDLTPPAASGLIIR